MHIAEQQRGWNLKPSEHARTGALEGMDTSSRTRPRPSVESPRDLPAPQPHLPLRKASAQRLQSRKGSVPRPLFVPSQQKQLRGFHPSSAQPVPQINNITASSEHAYAGREPHRPFKPPLGVLQDPYTSYYAEGNPTYVARGAAPPSSPLMLPPPPPSHPDSARDKSHKLKSSKSAGDGFRGLRHHMSDRNINPNSRKTSEPTASRPHTATHDVRESFRSGATGHSSFANTSSINTERSSLTGNSSQSEIAKLQLEESADVDPRDIEMSVEDAIGMYEEGFESGKQSLDVRSVISTERLGRSLDVPALPEFDRPTSQPSHPPKPKRPYAVHRRSQSASILLTAAKYTSTGGGLAPPEPSPTEPRSSLQITPMSRSPAPSMGRSTFAAPATQDGPVPRDRYGFKKISHYITVAQYDAWNVTYSEHIERRSKKWHTMMRSYGLSTSEPFRFPPKSDKIKRYIRKGIPPEFRGAAWFWYAGGPSKLAKEPGLYRQLLDKIENGELGETDREHIERDLNRTFPDNIRFKPDPTTTLDAQADAGGGGDDGNATGAKKTRRMTVEDPETPILQSLRRVLQTFAIHNPNVGYCQSLNFIAGLLLIFLDEDEEKAFILLNIVTSLHLPGTHGVALEGANIDIAVLMSCIKDSLPGIWNKLDDKGGAAGAGSYVSNVGGGALRLPTVSLATTAWFMSLFVGTLPIESVLRVWDCLFFEGSKTLFRIALAIFKAGETQILQVSDPMEIFQVVQTIPRSMLDINALLEVCFRRRGGFGGVSQGLIEARREEKRRVVKEGISDALADESAFRRLRGRFRSRTAKS